MIKKHIIKWKNEVILEENSIDSPHWSELAGVLIFEKKHYGSKGQKLFRVLSVQISLEFLRIEIFIKNYGEKFEVNYDQELSSFKLMR